jgi:hypothetical protein
MNKEQSELIEINVVNGICGEFQVWDYSSMDYMHSFTGEIDAQLFWVSYDHNDGYQDWGIAKHPEREKANGYLCKQVYLADFSTIPTAPVEVKTAEEILAEQFNTQANLLQHSAHCRISDALEAMELYASQFKPTPTDRIERVKDGEWLWYGKFDDLGWSLAPCGGKSLSQAYELGKREFEIVYTNNIEPYWQSNRLSQKEGELQKIIDELEYKLTTLLAKEALKDKS